MYIITVLVFCVNFHGYKRHRKPSRIPVKMLKRLSQKSRKLRCYVWSCLSKNVPRSSKVHHLIKNIATRKKSTHKTSSRFAQKMRRKTIFSGTRIVKDGAYYRYCAYVLRISRYSGFLSPILLIEGYFLRGLKLSGESRS